MTIELENLELIPRLLEEIRSIKEYITHMNTKRWYTVEEIAHYLGYSKDHIYKLKNDSFIENIHFYKKGGKILFDRAAVDEWVVKGETTDEALRTGREVVDRLFLSLKTL